MKARPWLVLFVLLLVLLLVPGSLGVSDTLAQGPTYSVYLPLVENVPAVAVLSNYFSYQTGSGTVHIVGEVQNHTAAPVNLVKVIVDFYDASHHVVANKYTYLYLGDLPSGDKSCFDLLVWPVPSYTSYGFEPPTYSDTTAQALNLTVVNPTASYDAGTGQYQIIGMVRNDGARRVNYVDVIGTLYTAAGTVVGCKETSVNGINLDPGQSSLFTLLFGGRDEADVATWRLQMDGWPE